MEPDYRYDRIKKKRGKKTRDLREGNGRIQSQKKMRTAIDGSASLIRAGVLAFVRLVCASCVYVARHSAAVFDLYTRRRSSGHIVGPPFTGVLHRSTLCCSSMLPLITHFWLTCLKARG